jgi:hypothetical protein
VNSNRLSGRDPAGGALQTSLPHPPSDLNVR